MGSLVAIEKLREHIRTLYKNDKRFAHIFLKNSNEIQKLFAYPA
jgi:hypothetical protein